MNPRPPTAEDPTELGGSELLGRIGLGGVGRAHLGEPPGGGPAAIMVIKPSAADRETEMRTAPAHFSARLEQAVARGEWMPPAREEADVTADA